MKKYLIWTALVLAAITACNKEVEAPVVDNGQEEATPGKVTLTFTAAISEETRTAYANDKTASWVAGDAISVCLTDGTNYEVVDFTTSDGSVFSAQVSQGYSIVSGVYPANSNHGFTAGAVTSVYLPDTYNLGTANDGGIALPMVGEMVNGTFTFHHICGALKIEVIDIFDALTFTTAGEAITGSFPLTNGRIAIPANGSASTVTFNYDRLSTNQAIGERGNRTFYIPVPDGTLTAGATMALKKGANLTTVFEKSTSGDIGFSSNKTNIKRMSALELQTPKGWSITVAEAESGLQGKYTVTVPSGTSFYYVFLTKTNFNETYHGSVAEVIEKRVLSANIYEKSTRFTMTNPMNYYFGNDYVILSCGIKKVNDNRQLTFDYCFLEWRFEEPTQNYLSWIGEWTVTDSKSTPNVDTWTISRLQANNLYTVSGLNGDIVTAIANYDATNNRIVFQSQLVGTTSTYDYYLFGSSTTAGNAVRQTEEPYDLMYVEESGNGIQLKGFILPDNTECARYYRMNYNRDTDKWTYTGARYIPSTMTRVNQ